jgi:hypothetical protein
VTTGATQPGVVAVSTGPVVVLVETGVVTDGVGAAAGVEEEDVVVNVNGANVQAAVKASRATDTSSNRRLIDGSIFLDIIVPPTTNDILTPVTSNSNKIQGKKVTKLWHFTGRFSWLRPA